MNAVRTWRPRVVRFDELVLMSLAILASNDHESLSKKYPIGHVQSTRAGSTVVGPCGESVLGGLTGCGWLPNEAFLRCGRNMNDDQGGEPSRSDISFFDPKRASVTGHMAKSLCSEVVRVVYMVL